MRKFISQTRLGLALIVLSSFLVSCSTEASNKYWGQVKVPQDNVMRYISGSEPESLDPQIPTGQPEARVLMALYDGLVEYHPKTMEPIPAIAKSWKVSSDGTEYTFTLREDAKFSNGEPIKAKDFVYSFRRALSPKLAAKNAVLAYYIKYAEAYNAGKSFVKGDDGKFLLKKDLEKAKDTEVINPVKTDDSTDNKDDVAENNKQPATDENEAKSKDEFFDGPEYLAVPSDKDALAKFLEDKPEIKQKVEGKELVLVEAENLGAKAIGDYTFKIKLSQPAPFFVGLLGHQYFRVIHQGTVEKFGAEWIKPENIVTSGAFKLKTHKPYDEVTVTKDPNNWDAANVKLDGIEFYPMDEQTTMMNLYKSGRVDALYNHTVPAAWNETIRKYVGEYLLFPEAAVEYYTVNTKKPPMDNVDIRRAFALAIDRNALATYRKTIKPLTDFTPEGIFPNYEKARTKVYAELLEKDGISQQEWKDRMFDPVRACKLFEKAKYKVTMVDDKRCKVEGFPIDEVIINYNTSESNKQVAEFVQAQWSQNLGLTVQLKNMEWKTYLPMRKNLEYKGFGRAGWVGDYMDPNTFLSLFYTEKNDSATGWSKPEFDKLLNEANSETNPTKRLEKLAEAEYMMIRELPIIPLSTNGTNWLKKPYIKGLYPNPGTLHPWKFVYIEKDRAKWDTNVENLMKDDDPVVAKQIEKLESTQVSSESEE